MVGVLQRNKVLHCIIIQLDHELLQPQGLLSGVNQESKPNHTKYRKTASTPSLKSKSIDVAHSVKISFKL